MVVEADLNLTMFTEKGCYTWAMPWHKWMHGQKTVKVCNSISFINIHFFPLNHYFICIYQYFISFSSTSTPISFISFVTDTLSQILIMFILWDLSFISLGYCTVYAVFRCVYSINNVKIVEWQRCIWFQYVRSLHSDNLSLLRHRRD